MARSVFKAPITALVTELLALPATAEAPFPGANGQLAFTQNADAIFAIDPAGGPPIRLTDPLTGAEDSQPAWAPDGRRIAFTSTRDSTNPLIPDQETYAMYADGRGGRIDQSEPTGSPGNGGRGL